MAAPTSYYVDPSINANSGAGTVGDPYGDLQHALDTVTRDSTDGDRFNIKNGTSEIDNNLDFTTYGTPTADAPLVVAGYTTSEGDGGQGVIDGNNAGTQIATWPTYTHLYDMRLTNVGAADICDFGAHGVVSGCEFDNGGTSSFAFNAGSVPSSCRFFACYFHDIGSGLVCLAGGMKVFGCHFAGAFLRCIDFNSNGAGVAMFNTLSITGASIGIYSRERSHVIANNSILAASGTGVGINLTSASDHSVVENNIIEGFSGTGGDGIDVSSGGHIGTYRNNAFFNNTANETGVSGAVFNDEGDNESLSVTGFDKSGSDTFANRFAYFSPVDTGNVRGGAFPTGFRRDKGAVQHADPAGGGGTTGRQGLHAIEAGAV